MAADTTPPIAYCVRCGAFSVRRARLLNGACAGAPTPNGKVALERIARGLHPWDHGVSRRSRGGSGNFVAWDAGRDMWIPSGGTGVSDETMDETQIETTSTRETGDAAECTRAPRGAFTRPATAASVGAGGQSQGNEAMSERGLGGASDGGSRGKRKADSLGAAIDHAPPLATRRRFAGHDTDVAVADGCIRPCPPQGTLPRSALPTASAPRDGGGEEAHISLSSRSALLRHLRATPGQCGVAGAARYGNAGAPGGGASPIGASRHADMLAGSGRLHAPGVDASPRAVTGAPRLPAPVTRAELLRRLAGAG